MPLYMDVHSIGGSVTVDDVSKARLADLQIQGRYDVYFLRYWVDERAGKLFCLAEAPSAEAAAAVHREAHGLTSSTRFNTRFRRGPDTSPEAANMCGEPTLSQGDPGPDPSARALAHSERRS